ncbi:hypothetical protein TSUD_394370 [Trifolium subterraneum]|uniref:Uncharacterized protein n=1 Tax=Trifolium subterraneum TaxID=3900 RepID=A0A2Z6MTV6_TRISU|nr:hypothetical protein TSUD_394370 [Trifolium subterraneum]
MSQLIDVDSNDVVPDSQPLSFLKDIIYCDPPVEVKNVAINDVIPSTMKINLNESFNVVAQVEGKNS